MNRQHLVNEIARRAKISKTQADTALRSTIGTITQGLKKGQRVSLVGFGTFKVKHRKARTGRNPQTGASIQIKARKVPVFSAGAELKRAVR